MSEEQRLIGAAAAALVRDGMTIGLGSGTTAAAMIAALGERVKDGLRIRGVPSSLRTEALAKAAGIPLVYETEKGRLDLTIDGAKEIDDSFRMIKGGGGSFFREKLLMSVSDRVVIVAERSKRVAAIGGMAVPVEIMPFGYTFTERSIARFGCEVRLRLAGADPVVSDNGNYIADCRFDAIPAPEELARELKSLTGVVETGLFVGMGNMLVTGSEDGGAAIIERQTEAGLYRDKSRMGGRAE